MQQKLELSDSMRALVIREIIDWLDLPSGSRGLDAGCGIGSHLKSLAAAVGAPGRVTGVDFSAEFLAIAKTRLAADLADCVTFAQTDANHLPFADDSFDWAWSVDCIGFAPALRDSAVDELIRVLKPGGRLALVLWSSQMLLPGHPMLEARLNSTTAGLAPFRTGMPPDQHYFRLLQRLGASSVTECEAKTFLGNIQAPLSEDIRQALISLFDMRWGNPQSELSSEDWDIYQRLCNPASPDFILDQPGYYAFFCYTLFHGKVCST